MRYIALLRGINVGGRNVLPMADLRRLFEEIGCGAVGTYIQSGNVVFDADASLAARLPDAVAGRIESGFGLRVPVQLRRATELRRVVAAAPFGPEVETKHRHVVFLADTPSPARVRAFDPRCAAGESYVVVGREIHLACPAGLARSKFTNAAVDRALATVSTTRNWRTVLALLERVTAQDA